MIAYRIAPHPIRDELSPLVPMVLVEPLPWTTLTPQTNREAVQAIVGEFDFRMVADQLKCCPKTATALLSRMYDDGKLIRRKVPDKRRPVYWYRAVAP